MGKGPCTFKEADITRAVRAAKKVGAEVVLDHEHKLIGIIPVKASDAGNGTTANEANEWDTEYGAD
jgi:hypothetical protein